MIVPRAPHHDGARAEAISRMGKNSAHTRGTISYYAARFPGGKKHFLELARLSKTPEILRFIETWDRLSHREQRHCNIDALCELAEVNPVDVMKEITGIAYEYGTEMGNAIASLSHPEIVKASVKQAKKADGHRDRKMLFEHMNFVPVPGGNTFHIEAKAAAASQAKTTVQGDESGVPEFEESSIATIALLRGDERPAK